MVPFHTAHISNEGMLKSFQIHPHLAMYISTELHACKITMHAYSNQENADTGRVSDGRIQICIWQFTKFYILYKNTSAWADQRKNRTIQ